MEFLADMVSSVVDTTNNMTFFDIIIPSDNFKTEESDDYSL